MSGLIVTPGNIGGRVITREELEQNVATYVQWIANSGLPADIGFAVVLFPKGESDMGVTGGNVEPDLLARVLHKAERRCKNHRITRPQ